MRSKKRSHFQYYTFANELWWLDKMPSRVNRTEWPEHDGKMYFCCFILCVRCAHRFTFHTTESHSVMMCMCLARSVRYVFLCVVRRTIRISHEILCVSYIGSTHTHTHIYMRTLLSERIRFNVLFMVLTLASSCTRTTLDLSVCALAVVVVVLELRHQLLQLTNWLGQGTWNIWKKFCWMIENQRYCKLSLCVLSFFRFSWKCVCGYCPCIGQSEENPLQFVIAANSLAKANFSTNSCTRQ